MCTRCAPDVHPRPSVVHRLVKALYTGSIPVWAGFFTSASGGVDAFLQMHGGRTLTIAVPCASMTQAFGVNDENEIVGRYTTGKAANAVTHGFTWRNGTFTTVNYSTSGGTTLNGVNDEGDIVGFYTDAKGNTDRLVGLR
jgi:hypothetical protein